MNNMLASYVSKYVERLVGMDFDTVTVFYAVAERGIRAENSETGEVFQIVPMDRSKRSIGIYHWNEDGWGWSLFKDGVYIEGQSSEEWSLLNCIQSIDRA
jgi:hypothetical protein